MIRGKERKSILDARVLVAGTMNVTGESKENVFFQENMEKNSMREHDLALTALRKQCTGKKSRIDSKDGSLVTVLEVFRNSERNNLIDAKVENADGSTVIVPVTALFCA